MTRRKKRYADDPRLYVRVLRPGGGMAVYPLRYLDPVERAAFLARATSPL